MRIFFFSLTVCHQKLFTLCSTRAHTRDMAFSPAMISASRLPTPSIVVRASGGGGSGARKSSVNASSSSSSSSSSSLWSRRRFGITALVIPPLFLSTSSSSSAGEQQLLTGDYETDTRDITARVRELLREGKGDVELYIKKFDAYASQYKWDHKGHTNSFASLLSLDQIVRKQYEYAGKTPWEVPPLSSNKGAMLEAYVRNSESCLIKEAYPPFGEMDAATRAEWKAIECSQGLVKPVKE